MDSFDGRIAVVSGGGTGMGHELVVQLARQGCHVATCDVSEEAMADTLAAAGSVAPEGVRLTAFKADVSDPDQWAAFRDAVRVDHDTQHINLLFNNAGIAGGGSFVNDTAADWERTFDVCWGGVYHGTRTFLPMLMASDAGHVINTSSVNGFFASVGPARPHTAYSAAKFAVKGFTEALITDFRVSAPHLRASVVMPGHVGTSILLNTMKAAGFDPKELTGEQIAQMRVDMDKQGIDLAEVSDEDIQQGMIMMADGFRDLAPTSAAQAATIILDGVKAGDWRILVGDDAVRLDEAVRLDPGGAYEESFWEHLMERGILGGFSGFGG